MNRKVHWKYKKRILDDVIDFYSDIVGAIYIRGPKWVGKTTTAGEHSKTIYELGSQEKRENFITNYKFDSRNIFNQPKPILFDEWQEFLQLWDDVRVEIDRNHGEPNQFFLTGSKEVDKEERKEKIHHSGVGRFFNLIMRPMSLYESGESNGKISLMNLFDENYKISQIKSELSTKDLIFATCRGGWPSSIDLPKDKALTIVEMINNMTIEGKSFLDENKNKKEYVNPKIMERFLKCYARNISTLASNETILKDINETPDLSISKVTYYKYKNKLIESYLIEEVDSWSPSFRTRENLKTSPKRYFVDPSIGIQILNLSPQKLLNNAIDYGLFFENLCVRDLRVYSSKNQGKVFYYRDRYGLETDVVLVLKDGRYALIEIKLGFSAALKASEQLIKVKKLIEEYNKTVEHKSHLMELPSALIVLHSGEEALTYKENVHIVPIGCLKD